MKRITATLRPFCTTAVWSPRYVASRTTSRSQHVTVTIKKTKAMITEFTDDPCMKVTKAEAKANNAVDTNKGHGELSTR